MNKPLWLALFCVLMVVPSNAANYYVDPVSGNDANDGSIGSPVQTLDKVADGLSLNPGDTVYLRGGLYIGNTNSMNITTSVESGTALAPITIRNYPGETPIVCNVTSPSRAIDLQNLSWFVFDGLTISNNYQSVLIESCTNLVFKNCSFGWMPTNSGIWAGFGVLGNSRFNTISNCLFEKWGRVNASCDDVGVSLALGNGPSDDPVFYNLVVSNRFFYGGHDHLQIETGYNVIRGNLFVNAPWYPTNATCNLLPSGGGPNMYGAWGNRFTKPEDADGADIGFRNVWEGNTMLYAGPPADDNGAFGIELCSRWCVYRGNSIAYALAAGIYISGIGNASARSNVIYGNTLYKNGLSEIYGGIGMQSFSVGIGLNHVGFTYPHSNNFICNNIVWNNYATNISTNVRIGNQVLGTNWTSDYAALADPLFVSTNGVGYVYNATNLPNFRLQSASPCINAGQWLTHCPTAGSGTTMVLTNSLWFSDGNQIVQGDTIQLQGQTATAIVVSNDWRNHTLYLNSALTWTGGQGLALAYSGSAPDMGAYENTELKMPQNFRIQGRSAFSGNAKVN